MDAFVEKMNQKAESIGALNSHFANPSGQDDPDQYTTPYDMALITKELIKDDYFLQVMANSTYEIPSTNLVDEVRYLSQQHLMLNTKKDLTVYREDVIAGKTGYTDAAKCTLVTVAKRENQIFIVVIMKSETFTNAYKDTANLLDYCFEHYTASQLEPGAYQTEIPVADSAGNNVGKAVLALTDGILLELPSESGEIRYEKNIPLSIESSKAIGDQVGTATIYAGSQILLNAPLFITDMKVELAESTTEATVAKAPEAIKKKGNFPFLLVLLLILALLIGAYLFYDKYFNRNWYSKRKNSR